MFAWLAPLVALTLATALSQGPTRNSHAVAVSDFEKRAQEYLDLRDRVKSQLAAPKPTRNPAEITERQQSLADGVRAARSRARHGDLFSPSIAPILREAIREDFLKRSPAERAAAFEEVPTGLALRVNQSYPKAVPLATVPPKLLAELPRLPDGLEYRFVGRALILHDTVTNLVVDVLDEAVPAR